MHTLYPVFLSLTDKPCLIAGIGSVGLRKATALLQSGANPLYVFEKIPLAELPQKTREFILHSEISFENRPCMASDIGKCFLVIAATSDPAENSRIASICAEKSIFCNCATNPSEGSFIIPAQVSAGNLCAAISTSGASPLLAASIRNELTEWLKKKENLAWLMAKLRPLILELPGGTEKHRQLFIKIMNSPLTMWLNNGDHQKCRDWLTGLFPSEYWQIIGEIIDEYRHVYRS